MRKREVYESISAGVLRHGHLYKILVNIDDKEYIMLISDSELDKLEITEKYQTIGHIKVEQQ
jgi:6-pyruvoyl-tetrahydropterin synthase